MHRTKIFLLSLLLMPVFGFGQVVMTNSTVVTGCSGVFTDSGGFFGDYSDSESSVMTLCATGTGCLSLDFTVFDVEANFDFLTIYDGPNTGSPQIGVFTGTALPGLISSSSGCLTFEFNSDGFVTGAGWEATILCGACGSTPSCLPVMGNCIDSLCVGSFFDPGGAAGNYGDNEYFIHTICADNGGCVNIDFTMFDMETSFDFINVYDGVSIGGTPIGSYTGNTLPPSLASSGGCLTFQFVSDGSINFAGFAATVSCGPCGILPQFAADCDSSIQVCSATNSFPITANGAGFVTEIPSSGTVANPDINPGSLNDGCLHTGEVNSTWLIFDIQTAGQLEFHFGGAGFPQTGYYDWIMYDLTNNTCADILADNIAPVRCNWNCDDLGGTGMAAALNIPASASACNYEPPLAVQANDLFVICFTNYSNTNGTVGFNFETGAGNATVNCSPILGFNEVHLVGESKGGFNELVWLSPALDRAREFKLERKFVNEEWVLLAQLGANTYRYQDPMPAGGDAFYRISMLDQDGFQSYSNVVALVTPVRDGIEIYPNPATDRIHLAVGAPQSEQLKVRIMDVRGKLIWEEKLNAPQLKPVNSIVDISALPKGMYFIRVNGKVKNFVKQ